jgi:hypothetical protein
MVLGILCNPVNQVLLGVHFKCRVLCTSFQNCLALLQSVANIFGLDIESMSNGLYRQLFVQPIESECVEVVDLMRPKSRIDKIAVQRQFARVSFAETFLNNARQDDVK